MSQIKRLIVIFLLVFHVKAQNESKNHGVNPLQPSFAVIIGILSIMFSLTFILLAYAKFCHSVVADDPMEEEIPQGVLRSGSRLSGIERSIIESLPFFKFSALKGSKEGLECAVCLSKFEETEILRLLPRCRHAFHINCIDKWLESHSSCPLCRYKFNEEDLTSFPYTNSLRYAQNPSNQSDEQRVELFIQREQEQPRSSRFNMVTSLQRLAMGRKEDQLLEKGKNGNHEQNLLHKFKHKIIVSDLITKSRWSDLNSSDLMSLNSEMLNVLSSRRFSSLKSNSQRFHHEFQMNEDILKIKEDMERKRLYASKATKIPNSPVSLSSSSNAFNNNLNRNATSKLFDPAQKRSVSEIVSFSRYANLSSLPANNESSSGTDRMDERIRMLWFPIAKRTVQWFAGRERGLEGKRSPPLNV